MSEDPKTITADQLRTERRGAYLHAFSGGKVIINHGGYPDGIFELTYRQRRACFSDEPPKANLNSAGIQTKETSAESFRYEERHPSPRTNGSMGR